MLSDSPSGGALEGRNANDLTLRLYILSIPVFVILEISFFLIFKGTGKLLSLFLISTVIVAVGQLPSLA